MSLLMAPAAPIANVYDPIEVIDVFCGSAMMPYTNDGKIVGIHDKRLLRYQGEIVTNKEWHDTVVDVGGWYDVHPRRYA